MKIAHCNDPNVHSIHFMFKPPTKVGFQLNLKYRAGEKVFIFIHFILFLLRLSFLYHMDQFEVSFYLEQAVSDPSCRYSQ